jgi:purine-binding chemotaxis protein CheW
MSGLAGRLQVTAGARVLALESSCVAEIIIVPPVTMVPHAPASLLGLGNLRGTVLPVVCLATLLGHPPGDRTKRSRVVVLSGAAPVGLLVEDVAALAPDDDGMALDPRPLVAQAFGALGRRQSASIQQAASVSDQKPRTAQDTLTLIGLQAAGSDFAIRLEEVSEIMRLPKAWAAVPRTDAAMLGVIAFRGGVLPLVSLAVLLGLGGATPKRGVILVVRLAAGWAGLVADAVSGSFSLAAEAIDPVPRLLTRGAGEALLEGICKLDDGRRLVGLLAVRLLLDARTQALLAESGAPSQPAAAQPHAASPQEQFVLFEIGGTPYGLPVASVGEVAKRPPIFARPPFMPDAILGMLSLRGRTVTVIDLAERLGSTAHPSRTGRVIVVSQDGREAGLAVDDVRGVLGVTQESLRPALAVVPETAAFFDRVALQHGGRMLLLLSPAFVLTQAEHDLSAAMLGRAKAGPHGLS